MKVILSAIALAAFCYGAALADDRQSIIPEGNVSSRPILEFRARDPALRNATGDIAPSMGHVFVFMGKELDNGQTLFNSASGFYPEHGNVKNLIAGKGTIKFPLDDIKNDQVFRVSITPEQERLVKFIIKNWETKTYSLPWQNCVSLQRDIGRALGLAVPEFNPADVGAEVPAQFVKMLGLANLKDAPVRYAELEAKRLSSERGKRTEELRLVKEALAADKAASEKRLKDAQRGSDMRRQMDYGRPSTAPTPPGNNPKGPSVTVTPDPSIVKTPPAGPKGPQPQEAPVLKSKP